MDEVTFSWYTHSNTLADLTTGLNLAKSSNVKSLLILTCSNNYYPEQDLITLFNTCSIPIFGGIYPMLTFQEILIKQGALIIGFQEVYDISLFDNLHLVKNEDALESLINNHLDKKQNFNGQDNFLMLYDGLMANIEDFIDILFESLDHSITIAGGGAGHLDFIQRPCLFTNRGLHTNAVLLITLPRKIKTSVAHGWKILQGPYLVSEAQGQNVLSLDYQPAFELYSQVIESTSDYRFTTDNFFDIAKHFPLGISDINNNLIVRDPILTKNNHLQCVGKIPINSMVYLLEGDISNLIYSAEKAAAEAFSTIKEPMEKVSMVFDCISRVLYMESEFERELKVINNNRVSDILFGVLSIGEIANSQSGSICLLNKSTVISIW